MTLWVCAGPDGCGTKYAVGLFRCPRCHNTDFYEDGDPMAKITKHGGASDATLPAEPGPETAGAAPEPPAEAAPAPQPEPLDVTEYLAGPPEPVVKGGEGASPGNSSPASIETPPTVSEPSEQPNPKRARTTGRRSKPDPTDTSSAPSTDGAQAAPTSAADDET